MPYKVKRPSKSYDIEVLSQALRLKLQELGQLEAENLQLSFRHNTLAATCDVLELLGAVRKGGQPSCAKAELMDQLQALMPSWELLKSPSYDAASQQQQQQHQQDQALSLSHSNSCESLTRSSSGTKQPEQQQQQQVMQCNASSEAAPFGGWVDVAEGDTLGTLQDPLRMLRHLLRSRFCSNGSSSGSGDTSDSSVGDYANMTLRQLQESYQNTVNQLALHLSFLDNPFKRNQQGDNNPFVTIKRTLAQHGCLLTKLLICGKEHLIPQFMMADCVSGQQQEQHNEQLYEYALQRLDLTSEQHQRIQATLMCFQGLLTAIMEERQAIQSQLFPQGMPAGPPGSSSSGNGAAPSAAAAAAAAVGGSAGLAANGTDTHGSSQAACCGVSCTAAKQQVTEDGSLSRSGSSSSGSDERSSSRVSDGHGSTKVALSQEQQARREQQQQHQQRLGQMFKLLKKESLLKCCCWVGVEGCMTYVQLAKLAVLCFPYPASPISLAQAVDRLLKQQQQQQPQQPARAESAQQQ